MKALRNNYFVSWSNKDMIYWLIKAKSYSADNVQWSYWSGPDRGTEGIPHTWPLGFLSDLLRSNLFRWPCGVNKNTETCATKSFIITASFTNILRPRLTSLWPLPGSEFDSDPDQTSQIVFLQQDSPWCVFWFDKIHSSYHPIYLDRSKVYQCSEGLTFTLTPVHMILLAIDSYVLGVPDNLLHVFWQQMKQMQNLPREKYSLDLIDSMALGIST